MKNNKEEAAGGAEGSTNAIDRAFAILEAIAERDHGLTNAELSRRLEIPKSSASYILRVLERRGYLWRDRESNRYHLGLRVLSLSRGVLNGIDVRDVALPALRQLMEGTHLTAHLAILDHGEAVYVERVEAQSFVRVNTWIGRRMEVHATAVGKALIAWLPEEELKTMLRVKGMRRHTSKTITVYPRLMQDLEQVRERGYAIDDEESDYGVRCVAAPILDQSGQVVAAIGVTGTTMQNDLEHLPAVAEMVREAGRRVSQHLGGHPRR